MPTEVGSVPSAEPGSPAVLDTDSDGSVCAPMAEAAIDVAACGQGQADHHRDQGRRPARSVRR